MQTYRVIDGPVRINAGEIVRLDDKQAHDRRRMATKNPDGSYTLKQPTDFKTGETFGYDGTLPRGVEKQVAVGDTDRTIAEARQAQRREESEKNAAASMKDYRARNEKKTKST